MPFGLYDPDEYWQKTGRDLLAFYREEGLAVFSLPVSNDDVLSNGSLVDLLKQASEQAAQGRNILIHRSAGLRRTALIAMLLVRYVLGLSGASAIDWLGWHQPGALLTPALMYGGK